MLIGVICEVVSAVAATERESISLRFAREKFPELNRRGGAEKRRANAGEAFVFQRSRIRLLVFSDEVHGAPVGICGAEGDARQNNLLRDT